jgi:hypothetical protein
MAFVKDGDSDCTDEGWLSQPLSRSLNNVELLYAWRPESFCEGHGETFPIRLTSARHGQVDTLETTTVAFRPP